MGDASNFLYPQMGNNIVGSQNPHMEGMPPHPIQPGMLKGREIKTNVKRTSEAIDQVGQETIAKVPQNPTASRPQLKRLKGTKIPKYDYQLQISVGSGGTAKVLSREADEKHIPNETINLVNRKTHIKDQQAKELLESLSKLQGQRSRIYLIGHSGLGSDKTSSDAGLNPEKPGEIVVNEMSTNELAELIAMGAPHLKKTTNELNRIKISIVACFAGVGISGAGSEDSYAAKLCKALYNMGIHAEVLARTGIADRLDPETPFKGKSVEGRHQATGDKISFTMQRDLNDPDAPFKLSSRIVAYKSKNGRKPNPIKPERIKLSARDAEKILKNADPGTALIHEEGAKRYLCIKKSDGKIDHIQIPKNESTEAFIARLPDDPKVPLRFIFPKLEHGKAFEILKSYPSGTGILCYSELKESLWLVYKDGKSNKKIDMTRYANSQAKEKVFTECKVVNFVTP